ncbi:MAG: glycosyltransferase [Nitrospirae bacterium]|nr:glycosyltransferase [Nitrospirota bacterium]
MKENAKRLPKVSIIVPVYNGSRYLREAIDSALAQSYKNVEVIVVNDGSNDNGETANIAGSYKDLIRYFHKENGGVASALNFGIGKMTGEYFSWLSHDDVYCPDKIERQVRRLARPHEGRTIIYSNFTWINEQSAETGVFRVPPEYAANIYLAVLATVVHGCSILVPKACFDNAGLFNERSMTTQDNEMWFRLAKAGYEFIHMPEFLLKSRMHSEQGQRRLKRQNITEDKQLAVWAVQHASDEFIKMRTSTVKILIRRKRKQALLIFADVLGWPWVIRIGYKTICIIRYHIADLQVLFINVLQMAIRWSLKLAKYV